jgi:uncharacterized protein involved in copper resistance
VASLHVLSGTTSARRLARGDTGETNSTMDTGEMDAGEMDTGEMEVGEMDAGEMEMSSHQAQAPTTRRTAVRLSATFTCQERQTLRALRDRYQQGHDHLSAREMKSLRFVQWLISNGRLDV